jgi:hypothetical protein
VNARYSRAPIAIGLLVAAVFSTPSGRAAVEDYVQDIFENRALKHHPLSSGSRDQAIVAALDASDIGKAYQPIDPRRSVLISDCGAGTTWCNDPPSLSGQQ